jgi:hypothetical protein
VSIDLVCGIGYKPEYDSLGGSFCLECPFGTVGVTPGICSSCPVGAYCQGGSSISIQKDHFYDNQTFFKCPIKDKCCPQGFCDIQSNDTCHDNSAGFLCSECKDGYFEWDGTCKLCNPFNSAILFFAFVILGISTALILVYSDIYSKTFDFVLFYQLASLVVTDKTSSSIISVLNLSIERIYAESSLICFTGISKELISLYFMPISILLLAGAFTLIAKQTKYQNLVNVPRIWFNLSLFLMIPLVSKASTSLQCVFYGSNQVLYLHPNIKCFSDTHMPLLIISTIILSFYGVLYPLYAIKNNKINTLPKRGKRLQKLRIESLRSNSISKPYSTQNSNSQGESMQSNSTLGIDEKGEKTKAKPLQALYSRRYYMFLPIDLIERLTITLWTGLEMEAFGKPLMGFLISFIILLPHVLSRPLRSNNDNFFRVLIYLVLMIVSGLECIKAVSNRQVQSWLSFFLCVPLAFPLLKLYVLLLIYLIKSKEKSAFIRLVTPYLPLYKIYYDVSSSKIEKT